MISAVRSASHSSPQLLYIAGKWVPTLGSAPPFQVLTPADEEVLTYCTTGCPADVDAAVDAAREAFPAWSARSGKERAAFLRSIAAEVAQHKSDLAVLEAHDSGKPLAEAEWDVDDVISCFEYYADSAVELDKRQFTPADVPDDDFSAVMRYEAAGVAAQIIPWNYPLLMAAWKIAPALAAGCTVVLKPSEVTPVTALQLAAIADSCCLPAGVLNIVTGFGADVGAPLAGHPGVDKVAFTGSGETGVKVMKSAAKHVTGLTLELGGKSPAIVFSDIEDIDAAVEWVMFGCFWTNGQICSATSRLLVHESIADDFLQRLVARTRGIKIGAPLEEGVKLGPLASKAQYDKVLSYIDGAVAEGATLLTGGRAAPAFRRGYYVEPTVLCVDDVSASIWREEVFGPVLAVHTFSSEEEAITLANDCDYGLAAAVFSADDARVRRVSTALRVGMVWTNCSQPAFVQLPWGGPKKSGIGRELSHFGLSNYLEPKVITSYTSKEHLGWYLPAAKL